MAKADMNITLNLDADHVLFVQNLLAEKELWMDPRDENGSEIRKIMLSLAEQTNITPTIYEAN